MSSNGPTVPSGILPRLGFYEERIDKWQASAAGIGIQPSAATALGLLIKNARAAYVASQAAKLAAKEATDAQTAAMRAMSSAGSDAIAYIKAFAEAKPTVAQRDAVFALASLPIPTPPSAAPAPQVPQQLSADPNANGTVTVRWKASGNAGSVYFVQRKLAGNNAFVDIGVTSGKSFVDGTVPAGTFSCQYQVRAVRGAQASIYSQPVGVQFGAGGAQGYSGNIAMAA
jgi:hypothetical protein